MRLCPPAKEGSGVDRFALHDGDRIEGWELDLAQAYGPMTACSTPASGQGRTPMRFSDDDLGQLKPWSAALILETTADRPHTSAALRHAVEAAERGSAPGHLPAAAAIPRTASARNGPVACGSRLRRSHPRGAGAPDGPATPARFLTADKANAMAHNKNDDTPLPIDMAAIRRTVEVMRAERAAALKSDNSSWLAHLVERDLDSYQELVAQLRVTLNPDLLGYVPKICAKTLGDTGTTRTLIGDQQVDTPFFHHGDLVVKGDLGVGAPFVVTGSVTVDGVLADCRPYSVVTIGGGVTARGVFTDGEMLVMGDIEADVVYGDYNDNTLHAGTIRARLVIEDEHETIATVKADLYFDLFDYQGGYGDAVQEQLREFLVDEVFAADEDEDADEEMFDSGLLFARLREGLPVFRADVAPEGR
ncbi:hypothetical protein [Streptomyces sp. EN16]|uniref:hypothetical protein n=1 Tax=Streptomyces sp. EN16 TaxID=212773 RepID=UPI000851F85F|nr:hypothetical protein [Streptomyces sp. EN16]